jgi:hypothetical protein
MHTRVFFILAVAALTLPVSAAAKVYDVGDAPLGVLGHGEVTAELTATDGAKPVRIAEIGGSLTIKALSDDVKVQCRSRGAQPGDTSTSCTGQSVLAIVTGSHFSIQATGKRFLLAIPKGYGGSVNAADAVQCGKASGSVDCRALLHKRGAGEGQGKGNGSGNGTANGTSSTNSAEPGTAASLAELAAALAALGK